MPNRGSPWIVAVVLAAGGAIAWRLGERSPRATTEEPAAPAKAPDSTTPPAAAPAPPVMEAPLPPIDLRVALSAFRSLAPADWRVRDDTFSPKGGGGPFADLPKEDFAAAAAAFRDGASVRLESPYGHATIVGNAVRFVGAPSARAFLDVERRLAEAADARRKAWFAALPDTTYVDGAGPNGSLPGFGESIRRPDRGYEGLRELQVFAAGPVVFELTIDDVGGLDAARVEAAVGAAAAYVTYPAHPVPAVVPLPAGAAWVRWEGLVVSVFGPDGTPVAAGSIAVIESGSAPKVTRVDVAKGLAIVPVRPIGGSLYLSSEALAPRRVPAPFPADGRVEVRLAAEAVIEGAVVDAAGHGIAGVSVDARSPALPAELGRVARVATGKDGGFRLAGLGDEEYVLSTRPPHGWGAPPPQTLRGGARGVRVELRPEHTVRLTIADAAGRPLAGASVRVLARGGVADPRDAAEGIEADSEGRVVVSSYDEQGLNLAVQPPRGREDLAPTSLSRWVPRNETITLRAFFAGIVRVVDETGKPASGDVLIDAYEPDVTPAMGMWRAGASATPEGRALLPGLEPRLTRIGIVLHTDPGVFPVGTRYAQVSPGLATATLRTARTGRPLVVRAQGGGGPLPVVLISADVHGPLTDIARSATTDADGLVTFEKVAVGVFWLFALGDPATGGPAGQSLFDFTGQAVNLPLVPSKAVRVHAPSTGGATDVVCAIGLPRRLSLPMTRKDGDVFELAGLPPGRYTLAVDAVFPDGRPAHAEYEIESGARVEVRVGDHVIERVEK